MPKTLISRHGRHSRSAVVVRRTRRTTGRAILVATGVALGYYIDPKLGDERRQQLLAKTSPALRDATSTVRERLRPGHPPRPVDRAA